MMSRRSLLRFMLPLAVLIAGFAVAQAPPAAAPPAPPPGTPTIPRSLDVPDNALVAAGKPPEIDLLYTGDVIGFIEPCG